MLFSTKVISASGNLMLNICDPELVNKTLNDGNIKIKFTVKLKIIKVRMSANTP